MLDVARECYSEFVENEAREWGMGALMQPNTIALRGDNGFVIASIVKFFYKDRPQCFPIFLCARSNSSLEGYRLLKSMVQSARERGAAKVHIGSETGFDFAPFAKRMGWETEPPSYVLRL